MAVVPASAWLVMFVAILGLWGVGGWALYRSLIDEERKLELVHEYGTIDTYSPRTMAELREWIITNPDHPRADEVTAAYNECVEILRVIDTPFYDWSESEIKALDTL